ncbi:MAG: transketolase C-terminal domain-containing protein [Candidatus Dormiibacterota bacterium]
MRAEFVAELADLAQTDEGIVLLTADLGFTVVEPFADRFPDRFYNVGVAETNMVAIATGLAREGLVPFCYSIAAFLSMRCYEVFRDGPIVHQLPVRMVAVGGGVGYGVAGITHYAVEDIGIMRSSGRVAIYAPPTTAACISVLKSTYRDNGPIYYRLGKDAIHDERLPVQDLTSPGYLRVGTEGTALVTYGRMATTALDVIESLTKSDGIALQCLVLTHLDADVVSAALDSLDNCDAIVTLEDHSPIGGVGSMVAECLASQPRHPRLFRMGLGEDIWTGLGASESRVLARSGLGTAELCEALSSLISEEAARCL